MLTKAYGETALSEKSYRDGFQKFKDELDFEDKEVLKCLKMRNWKPNCIRLKPNETITGALSGTLNAIKAHTQRKRAHYYSRHNKIILLYNNTRLHNAAPIKTHVETLNWKVRSHLPIHHTLPLLFITSSDQGHLICWSSTVLQIKISKIGLAVEIKSCRTFKKSNRPTYN